MSDRSTDRAVILGRDDLRAFDAQATELVLEMIEAGWTGRVSTKGHAIMRAPDGVTTMAISRESKRARSGRNQRAEFRRWMVRNQLAEEEEEEEEMEQGHERVCGVCGKTFETIRGLGAHERTHKPSSTCTECGKMVRYMDSHRQRYHSIGSSKDPVENLLLLLAEMDTLRAENAQLKADRAKVRMRTSRSRR